VRLRDPASVRVVSFEGEMKNVSVGILTLAAALCATQAAAETTASAFQRDRNVSVRERPHPEYAAYGFQLGGFTAFPRVTLDAEWTDNVLAVPDTVSPPIAGVSGPDSDWIGRVRPELVINSNWSRHALGGFVRASVNRYADFTREDATDWSVGANGKIDVAGNSYLFGDVQTGHFTEPRTSQGVPLNAGEAVQYNLTAGTAGAVQELDRLRFTETVNVQRFNYGEVDNLTPPPAQLNFNDRDRTNTVVSGKAEYAVSPAVAVYVAGAWNNRDYRLTSVPSRDSSGFVVGAGASFDLTHLMRGDIELGYLKQNYDDPAVGDPSGVAVRGSIEWFPTELTTVTFNANRSAQDSGVAGAAGYLGTTLGAQVDHELLRNVILTGYASYTGEDFQGLDRRDHVWGAGLSATYLMNRNVGLSLGYSYLNRASQGAEAGPDFSVSDVLASVTLQF
jgi:hypothetical protein